MVLSVFSEVLGILEQAAQAPSKGTVGDGADPSVNDWRLSLVL